jgi:uncharacterized protein YdiU (UPF0061 family)
VVCRVAPSLLRIGSLELPAVSGDDDLLRRTLAFTMRVDGQLPADLAADVPSALAHEPLDALAPELVDAWFESLCRATARLVADWMRVGFVHGVLNTDNVSLAALTIDYGPYGWLEPWDTTWTPNTTDAERRRYRYGAQPAVMQWNLGRLASAIASLATGEAALAAGLNAFGDEYQQRFEAQLADRLGWATCRSGDADLVQQLWEVMEAHETDYTITMRALSHLDPHACAAEDVEHALEHLQHAWHDRSDSAWSDQVDRWTQWLKAWGKRATASMDDGDVATQLAQRQERMRALSPRLVPRNWLVFEAIRDAEQGSFERLHRIQRALQTPYADDPSVADLAVRRPEWARTTVGSSMLSCSS